MPLTLLCRNATALNDDGSINEDAVRQFLQRFDLKRFNQYVKRWRGAHPRWIKMMMKAFGIVC